MISVRKIFGKTWKFLFHAVLHSHKKTFCVDKIDSSASPFHPYLVGIVIKTLIQYTTDNQRLNFKINQSKMPPIYVIKKIKYSKLYLL